MKRLAPLLLLLLGFAPPEPAAPQPSGFEGTWAFVTGDLRPAQRCSLKGVTVIKPRPAGEDKHQCRISAVFSCEKQPGKQLVMEQLCTASYYKGSVWINGLSVKIAEASPEGWSQPWAPDDFLLTHNVNFTQMAGRIGVKAVTTFTRIPDLEQ